MSIDDGQDLPSGHVVVAQTPQTLRVCLEYGGATRSLLWLSIGRDGSLYSALCQRNSVDPVRLVPIVSDTGATAFLWERVESIAHLPSRGKLSFHASGIIYSRIGRQIGVNLRLLSQRTLLCTFFPKHPREWEIVPAPRRRDLVIRDLLLDDCPVTVELYYQPAGSLPLMSSSRSEGVFVLPLGYTGVEGHQRVLLHLLFRRQPQAEEWPPRSFVAWPSVANRVSPATKDESISPDNPPDGLTSR